MKSFKSVLAASAGLAITISSTAFAQDTAKSSEKPSANDASAQVGEIVVTARLREERLKDVPVSITALGSAQLEAQGIKQTTDLFGKVPSLYFSQGNFSPTSDFTYLVIRGIGAAPALDPSVGIFIDGVYQPQIGFDLGFLDVERVEVLRGPQSTLFGRNTEAGAVSVVTRKPDDKSYGWVRAGADTFGGENAAALVSGPLTSNLFANVAGSVSHTDGFIHNRTLNTDQTRSTTYTTRGTLRWTPTDAVEAVLSGDYTKINSRELGFGVKLGSKNYDVEDNRLSPNVRKVGGGALTVKADLGWAALTSQTAYRSAKGNALWDADGTASNVHVLNAVFPRWTAPEDGFDSRRTEQNNLSQEIRLASNGASSLHWLTGVYLFRENNNLDRLGRYTSGLAAPGGPDTLFDGSQAGAEGVFIRQRKTGYSIFGQVTYDIDDTLQVEGGLRYASETAKARSLVNFLVPLSQTTAGINYYVFALDLKGDRKFTGWLPTATLRYKVNDTLTSYVTYSKGQKSGGFQKFPANALDARGFGAETSDNLEAGIKYSAHGVSFSASAYQIWLKNQQVSTTVLVDTGNGTKTPVGGVQNAASSTVHGFELESSVKADGGWYVQGSASYNKTQYTDYVDAQGLQRHGSIYEAFPYVPAWTASATLGKSTDIGGATLDTQVSWSYIGHYYVGDGGVFTPFSQIPSYSLVNARMSLTKGSWVASIFLDNVFDKYALTQILATSADPGQLRGTPVAPRRFGGQLTYKF